MLCRIQISSPGALPGHSANVPRVHGTATCIGMAGWACCSGPAAVRPRRHGARAAQSRCRCTRPASMEVAQASRRELLALHRDRPSALQLPLGSNYNRATITPRKDVHRRTHLCQQYVPLRTRHRLVMWVNSLFILFKLCVNGPLTRIVTTARRH